MFWRRPAQWIAIATALVAGAEGLRTVAYRDPVGIPTICFGETRGVAMGDRKTVAECEALLAERLQEFNAGINACVRVPMSPQRRAAVVSFAYNVGTHAACRSTFVRKLNAGDPQACDELRKWVYAKGIRFPGLVTRREEERRLCMAA